MVQGTQSMVYKGSMWILSGHIPLTPQSPHSVVRGHSQKGPEQSPLKAKRWNQQGPYILECDKSSKMCNPDAYLRPASAGEGRVDQTCPDREGGSYLAHPEGFTEAYQCLAKQNSTTWESLPRFKFQFS